MATASENGVHVPYVSLLEDPGVPCVFIVQVPSSVSVIGYTTYPFVYCRLRTSFLFLSLFLQTAIALSTLRGDAAQWTQTCTPLSSAEATAAGFHETWNIGAMCNALRSLPLVWELPSLNWLCFALSSHGENLGRSC